MAAFAKRSFGLTPKRISTGYLNGIFSTEESDPALLCQERGCGTSLPIGPRRGVNDLGRESQI